MKLPAESARLIISIGFIAVTSRSREADTNRQWDYTRKNFYRQCWRISKNFVEFQTENKNGQLVWKYRLSSRFLRSFGKPRWGLRLFQFILTDNPKWRRRFESPCRRQQFFQKLSFSSPPPERGKPITNWLEPNYTEKFFILQKYSYACYLYKDFQCKNSVFFFSSRCSRIRTKFQRELPQNEISIVGLDFVVGG